MKIRRLNTQDNNFWPTLKELLAWESVSNKDVNAIVLEILDAVRTRGDSALVEYTNTLDRMSVESMAELEISKSHFKNHWNSSVPNKGRRLNIQWNGFRVITNIKNKKIGVTLKKMELFWVKKSQL